MTLDFENYDVEAPQPECAFPSRCPVQSAPFREPPDTECAFP